MRLNGKRLPLYIHYSIGSQVDAEHVLSRLWIAGAKQEDTGNYTCHIPGYEASDFPRAKVKVHVVDGKISPWKSGMLCERRNTKPFSFRRLSCCCLRISHQPLAVKHICEDFKLFLHLDQDLAMPLTLFLIEHQL